MSTILIENNVNIESDSEYEDCELQEISENNQINPELDLNKEDNIINFIKNKFLTKCYIKNNTYSDYCR